MPHLPKETQQDDSVQEAMDRFIENAGKISANMLGMVNKVGGQIYALLFLSREPLSLDQIAETLQVSKGNVSINVRLLEEIKLVKKIWVKGSRRDFYEANREVPKKLIKGFLDRLREGIAESQSQIDDCHGQLSQASQGLERDSDRMKDAEFMMHQLDRLKSFYQVAGYLFEELYSGKSFDLSELRKVVE